MTALSDFADIGDVVDDFAEPFLIVRRVAGTYDDNGRFVRAADSETIDATGSVTPATPEDLKRLPEGRRTDESKRILTRTPVVVEPQADVIEWGGKSWEAASVAPWLDKFFDVVVVKKAIQ